MISRVCDRCGQPIEARALRYIARIQVYAAYDPLEITFDDLSRDFTAEMRRILEECRDLTEEDLMRDVYVDFTFDLCPACQKQYIQDPLQIAGSGN
ncbi:MAG: hypothetical protein KJ726_02815 [Verrucomicrobia bacterium]|nr:hypothetical protein [Verrucomicrobiota bacterium]MBU1908958.1 hypothetical protein [Verrucomicrobiota bacterium]